MHDSVAAIRAGRPRTRFAAQTANRRERQLGLRRASHLTCQATAAATGAAQPLVALRRAARSACSQPLPARGRRPTSVAPAVRRQVGMTWRRTADAGRRIQRRRSATPWRG
ncbi:MAG TPA: hypothetical protein VMP67_07450 [Candidatus Limnocylindria bacterium]|nr:hypothetical protein [Candidatus Limnocylindria bacterium]